MNWMNFQKRKVGEQDKLKEDNDKVFVENENRPKEQCDRPLNLPRELLTSVPIKLFSVKSLSEESW